MTEQTAQNAAMMTHDPLPEASWLWRRTFIFIVTSVLLFFMWGLVDRVGKVAIVMPVAGIPALVVITKWIIGFAGTVVTYYLVAPSAEQITKLVQTASILKSGVQIATRNVVVQGNRETPPDVESTSTVGKPPAPPVPEVTSDEDSATLPAASGGLDTVEITK